MVNGIVRRSKARARARSPRADRRAGDGGAASALDPVAYVRFASVYRNFREAQDFEEFISDLAETEPQGLTMMRAALALARRSLGRTWPIPPSAA